MKILPNGIAVIEGDTHISKWVEQSGRLDHDQNMLPLLTPYIRQGSEVIDIGAFIGDHTVFYATLAGHVYAFEPNPIAFECLKHNTKDCGIVKKGHSNVTCFMAGASDRRHHAAITEADNAGASYMQEAAEGVRCMPVDSLMLQDVSFIKMDCEGFEPHALRGLTQTIERCRPHMLIEVNAAALERNGSSAHALIDQVRAMGYSVRNVYKEQPLSGPQFDMVCIPM